MSRASGSAQADAEYVLDNPIWHALTTAHAPLALGNGPARSYPPNVTPLAGLQAQTDAGYQSLAGIARGSNPVALFQHEEHRANADWDVVQAHPITQMIWRGGDSLGAENDSIRALAQPDVQEMVALAALTRPGPLAERALELGSYYGIRDGDRLAAIAGERLHIDGFREVSAVCTHPDFRGRGYAAALVARVVAGILVRGETPFLHLKTDNTSAERVYERLGFRRRRLINLAVIRLRDPSTR